MENFLFAIIASIGISLISFVGILVLLNKIYKKRYIITALVSFAAGTLIGNVFWHLLPEQIEEFGLENNHIWAILAGILIMLLVEAYFHCSHDATKIIKKDEHEHHPEHLAKLNIIGDALHNFLDGIAIGASFLVNPALGVSTTIAVALHEIPQEFADVSVMAYAGWKRVKILVFNFLTALTAVLGVIVVFGLDELIEGAEEYLLPIAIGQFIYIALADLVPEIHRKSGVRKYAVEISMFIVGIVLMYALTLTGLGH